MTRSWWARGAPDRRRRCCWRARATASSLVDRATFPSDTVSTHLIHPPGVAALKRWGLLDRVVATGCPPIDTYAFDFGPFTISGIARDRRRSRRVRARGAPCSTSCSSTPRPRPAPRCARASRSRKSSSTTAASPASAATARAARPSPSTRASSSARTAGTHWSREAVRRRAVQREAAAPGGYYTYWSGLPMDGRFEAYVRPYRAFAAWPTNDDLTLVIAGWPFAEFEANKTDIEGNYLKVLDLVPAFAERIRGAKREERFVGMRGAELLPQALRPGLGAGRRRRLQQGLHHGAGDPRRVPRRRALRHRAGRVVLRRALLRRGDGRLPVRARRARPADVRVHRPARVARAAAARDAAAARRGRTATRRRWTGSRASTPA